MYIKVDARNSHGESAAISENTSFVPRSLFFDRISISSPRLFWLLVSLYGRQTPQARSQNYPGLEIDRICEHL